MRTHESAFSLKFNTLLLLGTCILEIETLLNELI